MPVTLKARRLGQSWRTLEKWFKRTEILHLQEALDRTGRHLESRIKTGILTGRPAGKRLARNAPSTIQRKGSDKPLIDTGTMVEAIQTISIPARRETFIGIPGTLGHADPRRQTAQVAQFHEFITKLFPILPLREFMGPVLKQEIPRIQKLFLETFGRRIGFTGTLFTGQGL